jgi:hypothetical protein
MLSEKQGRKPSTRDSKMPELEKEILKAAKTKSQMLL